MISHIRRFIALESSAGIVLALAAQAALTAGNSTLVPLSLRLIELSAEVRLGGDAPVIDHPWPLSVDDLRMAVFFFLIGLEIRRAPLAGGLASVRRAALPVIAAHIDGLAFAGRDPGFETQVRLAVFGRLLLAAVLGSTVLRFAAHRT